MVSLTFEALSLELNWGEVCPASLTDEHCQLYYAKQLCLTATTMVCLHFANRVTNYIESMFKIWGKEWVGPYLKLFGKRDATLFVFLHSYSSCPNSQL